MGEKIDEFARRLVMAVLGLEPQIKKFCNCIALLFLLSLPAILLMAFSNGAKDTYNFWKYGEEKNAYVVGLAYEKHGYKGASSSYYYELNIDGFTLVEGFQYKLPVGKAVEVLILPNNEKRVSLGREDSSLFTLYSYGFSSNFAAISSLGVFALIIFIFLKIVIHLVKNGYKAIE